jgi:hypothetical protein
MSLIMSAPAMIASRITSGLQVSIDSATPSSRSAYTAGITRASSSCTGTAGEPGRVDSPPMSMMSTPSRIISSARSKANSSDW